MEIKAKQQLLVFIRNPVLGKVKTRIAAKTGEQKALEIYELLLRNTLHTCSQLTKIKVIVYYSDFIDTKDNWNNDIFEKRLQEGNNLGERMAKAFQDNLIEAEKVVLIGSDCPYLTSNIIEHTFELLAENDVVFGPASDGGYYLMGMKSFNSSLFENISWSTSDVLKQSLAQIPELKTAFTLELNDIDTFEDYQQWVKEL